MKLAAVGTMLLLTASAAAAGDKLPRCFEDTFEGHCVVAEVNGQKTVKVSKQTKKLLKQLGGDGSRPWGNCVAHYEVPQPVRGDLDLKFSWLPEAVEYFGAGTQAQVNVYPLDGQSLTTHAEIAAAPSVRAEGSAVVTQADVIEGNRLPPGRYVLTARVSGSRQSWDCHGFFAQIAE
jgi:hypothetical protein